MKLVDGMTMRSIDKAAINDFGVMGLVLMENAGRGVAEIVKRLLSGCARKGRVAIVAGKGNNGGDGYVAARHLANSGVHVDFFSTAGTEELNGDALVNYNTWTKSGGTVTQVINKDDLAAFKLKLRHAAVIVDAIFGTGLTSEVKGIHADVIGIMNSVENKIVSVDIPSGIDADTGGVMGAAVRADITATMALPKLGLYIYPGRGCVGAVEVVDTGCPRSLLTDGSIMWNLITEEVVRAMMHPRGEDGHKCTFGHCLVVGGSSGKTGAAYMASVGAMRVGAGLTTVALPAGLALAVEAKTIEVMSVPLEDAGKNSLGVSSFAGLKAALVKKASLVVGPGLGHGKEIKELIKLIVGHCAVPAVYDADALNAVAPDAGVLKAALSGAVITPHPAEAARLLGISTDDVQSDRIGYALKLSSITGAVTVLKGAGTVIASPEGDVYLNHTGNSALATAGTGDVLAGMVGGLLASGYSALESAVCAVYMHGVAADVIRSERGACGMTASDLFDVIPRIMNPLIPVGRDRDGAR